MGMGKVLAGKKTSGVNKSPAPKYSTKMAPTQGNGTAEYKFSFGKGL
jgi:hypothetical protein